jgi:uncharacterized protein YndB with AHSA1/START domain
MTDTTLYDGVLERTGDGGLIRYERHLAYGIDEVWDAITNPERLADWWLPFDADISVDLRVGGAMVFTAAGDEPFEFTCTILTLEPPVLLEHTHADPDSVMRWELEATDAGCTLRLTHSVPDADAAVERCYLVGLHHSLARLEPALAGRPIDWDQDEFVVAQRAYAELGFAPVPD